MLLCIISKEQIKEGNTPCEQKLSKDGRGPHVDKVDLYRHCLYKQGRPHL